jgi:hypothetical protein
VRTELDGDGYEEPGEIEKHREVEAGNIGPEE